MADYSYQQHERVEQRKETGAPSVHKTRLRMLSGSTAKRINGAIGLRITLIVGTMWCAYAFFVLALISAPAAFATGQPLTIVAWIAQTFLQLVLLPIIIVGQNLQARAADDRAKATYDDAGAILEEAKQIQLHLQAQDDALKSVLDKVLALEAKIQKPA